MLILVSGATATIRDLNHPAIGQLIVPGAKNLPDSLSLVRGGWAMDNAGYTGVDVNAFLRMLQTFKDRPGCLFVAAPDKVGDARTTLQQYGIWSLVIRYFGYPVALVAQDGLTVPAVPWGAIDALFIGGTDAFKESAQALTLGAYAKARGKWLHMGRVNTKRRLRIAVALGCDSIDGSGFSKWPLINLTLVLKWIHEIQGAVRRPEDEVDWVRARALHRESRSRGRRDHRA